MEPHFFSQRLLDRRKDEHLCSFLEAVPKVVILRLLLQPVICLVLRLAVLVVVVLVVVVVVASLLLVFLLLFIQIPLLHRSHRLIPNYLQRFVFLFPLNQILFTEFNVLRL